MTAAAAVCLYLLSGASQSWACRMLQNARRLWKSDNSLEP